jgi:hypothetical protein
LFGGKNEMKSAYLFENGLFVNQDYFNKVSMNFDSKDVLNAYKNMVLIKGHKKNIKIIQETGFFIIPINIGKEEMLKDIIRNKSEYKISSLTKNFIVIPSSVKSIFYTVILTNENVKENKETEEVENIIIKSENFEKFKQNYKKMMLKYHPDLNPNTIEIAQRLNEIKNKIKDENAFNRFKKLQKLKNSNLMAKKKKTSLRNFNINDIINDINNKTKIIKTSYGRIYINPFI